MEKKLYIERSEKFLDNLLNPSNLKLGLTNRIKENKDENVTISVIQIAPTSLKDYSMGLQYSFDKLGTRFFLKSTTFIAKDEEDKQPFFENINSKAQDFIILQVHGMQFENRLLESYNTSNIKGKLIVVIHRPEELILRISLEEDLAYNSAKDILAKKLEKASVIVLLGKCFIKEYKKFLPDTIVTSIPHGFKKTKVKIDITKRFDSNAVNCIGSNTTWGEMRYIDDLIGLMREVHEYNNNVKVFGYVSGKFYANAHIEKYVNHSEILFVSNDEIIKGYENNLFSDEISFREWLYRKANGKILIRGMIENNDIILENFCFSQYENLFKWESTIIDFDLQMYHEILDKKRPAEKQGLPKVEYSGTLHKGIPNVIFIVFESDSMNDVEKNEGFKMIKVRSKNGAADFKNTAKEIIDLIIDKSKRKEIINNNEYTINKIGLEEIVFAFYKLCNFLEKENI